MPHRPAIGAVTGNYRRITSVEIGGIVRELLNGRISQSSDRALLCDCPNHQSQSKRSLTITLDRQGWYCFGCGTGGDILQLVEFVRAGCITHGQSGRMPDSHREARDFLANKVGMPSLSHAGLSPEAIEQMERERRKSLRDRVYFYTEVYEPTLGSANPSTLSMQVRVLDQKTSELQFDTGMASVAGYVQPGNLMVPFATALPVTQLPPGSYRLEVKAAHSSGPDVVARTIDFELN